MPLFVSQVSLCPCASKLLLWQWPIRSKSLILIICAFEKGFDEFMNVVLDESTEVYTKKGTRRDIGRIVIKGDNIALICNISE